ncbi:MAG TPA: shikimate dehydrogenase, partial [Stellaceae bacterium]|nr:shikimate dehydrogenase [Stellaceae bacterium]
MGWPVEHSRSPLLHGFWLKQHNIDGAYVLLPVKPEDLAASLRDLGARGFAGCNLTVPHKQAALAIVDKIDAVAARIGAINTVIVHADGTLEGRNTDVFGFRENLRAAQPGWRASAGPVVVLGAGGAARAVVAVLLDDGAPAIRL